MHWMFTLYIYLLIDVVNILYSAFLDYEFSLITKYWYICECSVKCLYNKVYNPCRTSWPFVTSKSDLNMCNYSTSNKFIQWASFICTTWPSNIFPHWIQKGYGRLGASALYHCFSTIKAVGRKKYPNEKTQRQVREM